MLCELYYMAANLTNVIATPDSQPENWNASPAARTPAGNTEGLKTIRPFWGKAVVSHIPIFRFFMAYTTNKAYMFHLMSHITT